jgi:NADP-reducing hydrogenase subunit HndD
VVEVVTQGEMKPLEFTEVRGMEGIKEAAYALPGKTVRVCVASGLANAKKVLDGVKSGELEYDFIEIMGCPGGCVNGGGQPIQHADVRNWVDLRSLRANALYAQDAGQTYRKSHENPVVQQVYEEFLGEPGSHKAHEILHTTYVPQTRYRR